MPSLTCMIMNGETSLIKSELQKVHVNLLEDDGVYIKIALRNGDIEILRLLFRNWKDQRRPDHEEQELDDLIDSLDDYGDTPDSMEALEYLKSVRKQGSFETENLIVRVRRLEEQVRELREMLMSKKE